MSGKAVASAISTKADSSELATMYLQTETVNSNHYLQIFTP